MNISLKSPLEKQPCKEKACNEFNCNFQFFGAIDLYKNNNVHQKTFVENLGLLNQKSFSHSICWEYLAKAFGKAITPSYCFPFQKNL